jgi:predicted phosphoadenosine phosphosulfate sulfurtransferase
VQNEISHATAGGKHARKIYLRKNVLEAAQERMAWAFDTFKNVLISVSGGKDSTVLFELAHAEAVKRGRDIHVLFLDQEAEYEATIDIVRGIMARERVIAHWYQIPILMTNATSYEEAFLHAWQDGVAWVREKEPNSIHAAPEAPDRFYAFFNWWEKQWGSDTCMLIGLRSEESLNRYGAVTRNPAFENVTWSSKSAGAGIRLYPIYDWTVEDIWTYIGKFKVPYNRVYDWMWAKGERMTEMRVSNLIHERAFRSLSSLQEFEPQTYGKMLERLKGVHTAALYAEEQQIYSAKKLPKAYKTWLEYRDFLLTTLPSELVQPFLERFAGQKATEGVYRQQVRQLLINDWENNIPVVQKDDDRENVKEKWMAIL